MTIDTSRFRFIADALNGSGGFKPKIREDTEGQPTLISDSYLIRYQRESAAKYAGRNHVAWYVNDLRSACTRFVGYLAKKPPIRDIGENPLIADFMADCDWQGNSLDQFLATFSIHAKARGSMLLLVDMPNVEDERRIPYLAPLYPESIHSYELGNGGLLTSVEIYDEEMRIRGWDTAGWWIREGERIISNGEHNLGVCPVIKFSEGEFPDEGEFSQIADLSRRLFNLRSELDEILRAQTFSILAYHFPPGSEEPDASKLSVSIGTGNMLPYQGDAPSFIAPPDAPARVYMDKIAALEEKVRRVGHVIEAPERAESGLALTIRFQQLNSSLVHWAGRMESIERRIWDLVSAWLGTNDEIVTMWPDDYAIADRQTELDMLGLMLTSGFSTEVLAEKRQQIVALDFASMEDDQLNELLAKERESNLEN